jgi:hypothetical protein
MEQTITRTAWVNDGNSLMTEVTTFNVPNYGDVQTYFTIEFGSTNGISAVNPMINFTKADFDALPDIANDIATVQANIKTTVLTLINLL